MRSALFVPADSEKKLAKGPEAGADALLLDLEDAVALARKPIARAMARDFLRARKPEWPRLVVRVNAWDTGLTLADLAEVVTAAPDGIMLPKCNGAEDVKRLDWALAALEAREGLPVGGIGILPIASETAQALFAFGTYAGTSTRLIGLTWGGEDLAAAVGARANKGPDGQFDDLFRMARALCIAGAGAAGIPAIDTVFVDFRDEYGLRAEATEARRMGFGGKAAIHPAQVGPINEAFTPTSQEREWAKQVLDAFSAAPDAGVVTLGGKMVDKPHLLQARRILGRS